MGPQTVDYSYHGDELDTTASDWPKRPPPGAKLLCSAEWSVGPTSGRSDLYKGWSSARAGRVFIWCKDLTLELAPVRFRPYASGPLGDDEIASFAACLSFGWRSERLTFDLGDPPDQVEAGVLSESVLADIEKSVWSEEDDGDDVESGIASVEETPVSAWVGKATWPPSKVTGVSWWSAIAVQAAENSRLRAAVTQYVERYLQATGALPVGVHQIDEEMGVEPPGIDPGAGMRRVLNRPGRIQLRVTFPNRLETRQRK